MGTCFGPQSPNKRPQECRWWVIWDPPRGTSDDPKLVPRDQLVWAVMVEKGQKRLNFDRNYLSMRQAPGARLARQHEVHR